MPSPLPISETLAPADQQELSAAVQSCYGDDLAVYTVGGGRVSRLVCPQRSLGSPLRCQK